MFSKKPFLRPMLILLTTGGVVLTSLLLSGTMLLFQRNNIEESLLDSNQAYARKLADTTDRYLTFAQRELAWSAASVRSTSYSQNEVDRLRLQSGMFNSVGVVNAQSVLVSTSPYLPALTGVTLHSQANQRALAARSPLISDPFTSVAGNEMILLSQPILAPDGRYLGYLGGSIYLKKQSLLSDILSLHFYEDNITISVVDNNGRIIFSRDTSQKGSFLSMPAQIRTALQANKSGHYTGLYGQHKSLVGYASLNQTSWNIFVSTPANTVTRMLWRTVEKISGFVLVILVLVAGSVALLSSSIARPLEQLAGRVRATDSLTSPEKLSTIKAWYQEADMLRNAMQNSFRSVSARFATLSDEAMTDPLTGLYNRRGFHEQSARVGAAEDQYAIAIDIDHFKTINDRFGHDAGDLVLVRIADLLKQTCRDGDIISRFGGEEFIVLLPDSTRNGAMTMAERIRRVMAGATFSRAGHITISAGVAGLRECGGDREKLLRMADQALYQAKQQGRNQVVFSEIIPEPGSQ